MSAPAPLALSTLRACPTLLLSEWLSEVHELITTNESRVYTEVSDPLLHKTQWIVHWMLSATEQERFRKTRTTACQLLLVLFRVCQCTLREASSDVSLTWNQVCEQPQDERKTWTILAHWFKQHHPLECSEKQREWCRRMYEWDKNRLWLPMVCLHLKLIYTPYLAVQQLQDISEELRAYVLGLQVTLPEVELLHHYCHLLQSSEKRAMAQVLTPVQLGVLHRLQQSYEEFTCHSTRICSRAALYLWATIGAHFFTWSMVQQWTLLAYLEPGKLRSSTQSLRSQLLYLDEEWLGLFQTRRPGLIQAPSTRAAAKPNNVSFNSTILHPGDDVDEDPYADLD